MKLWIPVLLAAVVGASSGVGLAIWRVKHEPWDGTPEGSRSHLAPDDAAKLGPNPEATDGSPEVAVDHEEYDFGVLSEGGTGTHDFVFTNKGTGTLKLSKGHTTCKCTMANLDQAEVQAGKSTKVHLEFRAKGFAGRYKQSATVVTNDPNHKQIQLTVTGKIIPVVRAVPEEIVFSSVTAGEAASIPIEMYDYQATPLKITSHEFAEKSTASFFDLKIEPMNPETLAKESGAKSGVHLVATVKPGLPIGNFKQTIRLATNLPAAEQYTMEVRGNVVSDLAIVGADWDDERSLLTIGTVSGKEETSRRLILVARGPFRDQIRLKVAEQVPDLLKVEFEPSKAVGSSLRQFPIVIRIPKGTPPADYVGSDTAKLARIVLETNHPRAPKLLIRVRFAVQN